MFNNTGLSLILIALGMLGVILSFMVPDRKKSLISIILAAIIILSGVIQMTRQSLTQRRWKSRMDRAQSGRRMDIDEMRKRLKAQAEKTRQNASPGPSK